MEDDLRPEGDTKHESSREYQQGQVLPRGQKWHVIRKDLDVFFWKGLFILISVFIVLAAFGLYFSINDIIDTWVVEQYVPFVKTIYYVAVIALCLYLMKIYVLRNKQ